MVFTVLPQLPYLLVSNFGVLKIDLTSRMIAFGTVSSGKGFVDKLLLKMISGFGIGGDVTEESRLSMPFLGSGAVTAISNRHTETVVNKISIFSV